MNEKPKRDHNPPAFDFVTSLTIPECVKQLNEAVASHYSIRIDEQQFWIQDTTLPGKIFELEGYLAEDEAGTRVSGWQNTYIIRGTSPKDYVEYILIVCLYSILLVGLSLQSITQSEWGKFFLYALLSLPGFVGARYLFKRYTQTYLNPEDKIIQWIYDFLSMPSSQ